MGESDIKDNSKVPSIRQATNGSREREVKEDMGLYVTHVFFFLLLKCHMMLRNFGLLTLRVLYV